MTDKKYTINWAAIRAQPFAPDAGPPDWPQGVRSISQDGLSLIGIGPGNTLYWDGKELVTRQSVTLDLTFWERVFATGAALGVVVTAVVEVLEFFGYGVGAAVGVGQ
jgi:hypothetical protein